MTIYLKQSTASQEVALGFFVDSTDGNTEETGLTIAAADIRLHKAGGTTLTTPAAGATHISNGIYYWVADATDTGTLGPLVIYCHPTGALAVRVECCVLAANVYDSLIGGGDLLQVDTTQLAGQTVTAGAGVTFPTSVASPTNITAGIITTVTNLTNLPAITANWLTAAGMDATASAEIADAVWDEAISGHVGAGSTGAALDAAGSAGDPWTTPLPGAYGAGTAGKIIGDNINATISSRSTYAGADTVGVTTLLGRLTSTRAGLLDNLDQTTGGVILTAAERTSIADAILGRNISGGSSTGRTVKQALHVLRNKWLIAAGTQTVYDTDDTTVSWTQPVTGTVGADPITGVG